VTNFRHELDEVGDSLQIRLFGDFGLGERDQVNAPIRAAQADNRPIVVDL
jgi:hypothetical protein